MDIKKYNQLRKVHDGVNTRSNDDHWSRTALGEEEYDSMPTVMDKATEQRVDMEEVTWNLNVEPLSTAKTKVS